MSNDKYLNNGGLSHYDDKIKAWAQNKLNNKLDTDCLFYTGQGTMEIQDMNGNEIDLVPESTGLLYSDVVSGDGIHLTSKDYVDGKTGDLTTLNTDSKNNLVDAINEVYEKSGEPFRVKQWAGTFEVVIPTCTTDISNTQIPKMVFSIDAVEGASYQIVGMIAYEVFDSATGGNRLNVWPVCQFTGNGQKELSVRWMCAGTTSKTARRINAWVLLKHR